MAKQPDDSKPAPKPATKPGETPPVAPAPAPPRRAPVPKAPPTNVSLPPGSGAHPDSLGSIAETAPAQGVFVQPLTAGLNDPTGELGGTGLKGSEPYGGWLYEEFLPQLRGLQGARLFREMADNDPMCGAVLFALEMLIKKVDWRVEPADTRPESIVAAERIQEGLFNDLKHPWGQLIDEATSMLTYGYAPHEIIWKFCRGETDDPQTTSAFKDGLLMPAAMPIRSQETIWRWIMDVDGRGDVLGVEQYRIGVAQNAIIPIQKMLLFRTTNRKNNPEGKSILRNAYSQWYRKKVIEQSEGRMALRSAGIVNLTIPGKFMIAGAGTDEAKLYAMYKQIADQLAQDRSGSIVLPSDKDDKGNALYSVSYLAADARNVKDFSPIIDRMDARIAVSVLADFLLLGTKNVGSFALGDSKINLFALVVESLLGGIAEECGRVLLRKIWKLNALDPTIMPKLKYGNVQKADLDALGTFIANLAKGGMVLFPSNDGRLEQHLLSIADLPSTQEEG